MVYGDIPCGRGGGHRTILGTGTGPGAEGGGQRERNLKVKVLCRIKESKNMFECNKTLA